MLKPKKLSVHASAGTPTVYANLSPPSRWGRLKRRGRDLFIRGGVFVWQVVAGRLTWEVAQKIWEYVSSFGLWRVAYTNQAHGGRTR